MRLLFKRLHEVTGGHEEATADHIGHIAGTTAEPTDAQKVAGNYRKARFKWNGLEVAIENPRGSIRSGKGWAVRMGCHYGYFVGRPAFDGDDVDVFMGPFPHSPDVWVLNQVAANGKFDEHKVLVGFRTEAEARQGYLSCYSPGWKAGPMVQMDIPTLKERLASGAFAKGAMAKGIGLNRSTREMFGAATYTTDHAVSSAQSRLLTAHAGAQNAANPLRQRNVIRFGQGAKLRAQQKQNWMRTGRVPKAGWFGANKAGAQAPKGPGAPHPLHAVYGAFKAAGVRGTTSAHGTKTHGHGYKHEITSANPMRDAAPIIAHLGSSHKITGMRTSGSGVSFKAVPHAGGPVHHISIKQPVARAAKAKPAASPLPDSVLYGPKPPAPQAPKAPSAQVPKSPPPPRLKGWNVPKPIHTLPVNGGADEPVTVQKRGPAAPTFKINFKRPTVQ